MISLIRGLLPMVLIFASIFWPAGSARACSLDPGVAHADRLAGSKAAFIGTLLSKQPLTDSSIAELADRIYRFRVQTGVKGVLGEEVSVRFGSDFAGCTGEFSTKEPVGILLFQDEGDAWLSGVGGFMLPNDLKDARRTLGAAAPSLQTAKPSPASAGLSASSVHPNASSVQSDSRGEKIPLWTILLIGSFIFGPAVLIFARGQYQVLHGPEEGRR